jgi:hypothetical protein
VRPCAKATGLFSVVAFVRSVVRNDMIHYVDHAVGRCGGAVSNFLADLPSIP